MTTEQREVTLLRAFLFDFDGTIADTEPLHLRAFRAVLSARGITIDERTYYDRYLVGTDRECLARMLDDFGRPDLRPEIETLHREKLAAMEELLAGEVRLFPGARAFLDEASTIGPLAIVTGAVGPQVRAFLHRSGLEPLFAVVVAAGDVQRGKPDPEGYVAGWQLLREQGLFDLEPWECLAVEDSPSGIVAARDAGMRTLALAHSRPAADLRAADEVADGYDRVDWGSLRTLYDPTGKRGRRDLT